MTLPTQTSRNPVIISQSSEDEVDRNFFKIVLLGILGAAFSLAAFYKFNIFVETFHYPNLWLSVAASLGFLTIFILETFFIKRSGIMTVLLFVQTGVPLVIFRSYIFPQIQWALLGGWIIFFVWSIFGVSKGMRLLQNSLTVSFFPVARAVLSKTITGLLVFSSVIVYSAYLKGGKFNDEIGQKMVSDILNSGAPIISAVFPGASFDATVKDFLNIVAEVQLRNINVERNLSPQVQQEMVYQVSGELLKSIEEMAGPINENNSVRVAVYNLIKKYFEKLPDSMRDLMGVLFLVLIFLTLKGVAFILYWLVELIAFLIFKICIITGFAYINLQQRSREFIMLS